MHGIIEIHSHTVNAYTVFFSLNSIYIDYVNGRRSGNSVIYTDWDWDWDWVRNNAR